MLFQFDNTTAMLHTFLQRVCFVLFSCLFSCLTRAQKTFNKVSSSLTIRAFRELNIKVTRLIAKDIDFVEYITLFKNYQATRLSDVNNMRAERKSMIEFVLSSEEIMASHCYLAKLNNRHLQPLNANNYAS
jgi:hypothetical protein